MKSSVAIKAALAGSVLLASAAYADVAEPTTGNGELTLFVLDTVTNSVYARGLQVTMDSFAAQGTAAGQTGDTNYTGPETVNFSLAPVTQDGTLQSFLGTGHTYVWGVMAGDSSGTASNIGSRRYLTTSTVDATVAGSGPSNANITGLGGQFGALFAGVNGNIAGTAVGDGSSVAGANASGGLWGDPTSSAGANAIAFFNLPPGTSGAAVGTAQTLYLFANSSSSNSGTARVFLASQQLVLGTNGTLQLVGGTTPQVPLPAAAWLLGSGLLGLVGVGRRRRQATSVEA